MKIGTKFLLSTVFGIVNVYARGKDQVLDVQQSDDLDGFKMGTSSTWNDTIQKDFDKAFYVHLYDNVCDNTSFTPNQDSVSQIRVVFPTESLLNVWGNDNYWIGFSVTCNSNLAAGLSNTNWHKFTKPNNFDENKKYTRMTLRVGKCREHAGIFLIPTGVGHIVDIKLLYKIHGFKSKNVIPIGHWNNGYALKPSPSCTHINNFHTIMLSHIPVNDTDKPY